MLNSTVLYGTVMYSTVPQSTVLYNIVQYGTSLVNTYLLIKLLMLGHLDKSLVVGGWHCNSIIASNSSGPGRPRELIFSLT